MPHIWGSKTVMNEKMARVECANVVVCCTPRACPCGVRKMRTVCINSRSGISVRG